MFELIKECYLKSWIMDAQLERYVILGAVTQEQANKIKESKV